MNAWVDDETVHKAQATGDTSLLVEAGVQFCMSPDNKYCIVMRDHASWHVEGEGWRDGNYPPEDDMSGRQMLNFFKSQVADDTGYWFKVFIPETISITSIYGIDEMCCELATNSKKYKLMYDRIDGLLWECMSGNAESEKEITEKFEMICNP